MIITATRFHDFSYGHRVFGHEGKCRFLHGHNGRVHFTVRPLNGLDGIGRVMDFSVINTLLCNWIESQWDHKFLVWDMDPMVDELYRLDKFGVVRVNFNPTAEHMAAHLLYVIGPQQLVSTGVEVCRVVLEETRKCSATAELPLGTITNRG